MIKNTQNNIFISYKYAATFLLSFSSGFIDVATFMSLSGLFTSHITGNLAAAATSIIESNHKRTVSHMIVIFFFILGILLGCIIAEFAQKTNKQLITCLLLSEAFFLLLFLIAGNYFLHGHSYIQEERFAIFTVFPAAVAMGIQSGLMKESKIKILPTTAMTGNLTLFITELYRLVRYKKREKHSDYPEAEHYLKITGTLLGGFILGAAVGAAGMMILHFWSISLPLTILLILSFMNKELITQE